jgi:hypothetical protein
MAPDTDSFFRLQQRRYERGEAGGIDGTGRNQVGAEIVEATLAIGVQDQP